MMVPWFPDPLVYCSIKYIITIIPDPYVVVLFCDSMAGFGFGGCCNTNAVVVHSFFISIHDETTLRVHALPCQTLAHSHTPIIYILSNIVTYCCI